MLSQSTEALAKAEARVPSTQSPLHTSTFILHPSQPFIKNLPFSAKPRTLEQPRI
ncbi:hypothetical protein VDG1235_3273 [Verrucomicrobiia bacterium DG1235]|nr:hypothetical protein VDG1235_3273 [Verrucomicrobiae bacterium DG1235]